MHTRLIAALVVLLSTGFAAPANADLTGFIGTANAPSHRPVRGLALGIGLLVVGFEFEYAGITDDEDEVAPSVNTGMGNVLLQTPFPIMGLQPYFTTGAGLYRETLGEVHRETNFLVNTGGGVKVSLLGPIRVRFDYRILKLRGEALHSLVHRVYAGVNLAF